MAVAAAVSGNPVWTIVTLSVAIAGVMAARPPFWTLPTEIAAINSIGNLGGFFGPTLIGYAREMTGSFTLGLMVSACTLLLSTLFTLSLRRRAPAHVVATQA